jgi:hypothetical protein
MAAAWTSSRSRALSSPVDTPSTLPTSHSSHSARLLASPCAPLAGAEATAAAAACRRCAPPPVAPPLQLWAQMSPRWAYASPCAPTRPGAPSASPKSAGAAPPPPPRAALQGSRSFQGLFGEPGAYLWCFRSFQGPRCKTVSQIVKSICWIL